MFSTSEIQKKKKLFKLPFKRDQLEYWGPVNHPFADSFLTMGYTFLNQYLGAIGSKTLKSIFSSFVEMVQNVAEYNEGKFQNNFPQSYVRLKSERDYVVIDTANIIKDEDVETVDAIFARVLQLDDEGLKQEFDKTLLKGGSLGLIMLRRLKNSTFEYKMGEDETGAIWLSQELKVNYGNT